MDYLKYINIIQYHSISIFNVSLVGGLEHFLFSHILGIIIPIDLYFSEGFKPPTRFDGGSIYGISEIPMKHAAPVYGSLRQIVSCRSLQHAALPRIRNVLEVSVNSAAGSWGSVM